MTEGSWGWELDVMYNNMRGLGNGRWCNGTRGLGIARWKNDTRDLGQSLVT